MRDQPQSVSRKGLEKIRRDGVLATLQAAPNWLLRTALGESVLVLRRCFRRIRYRREGFVAIPDASATIDIDPTTVTHMVPFSRFGATNPRTLLGTIRGGDWDLELPRVEDRAKYQACRARVEDGRSWEETGIIDQLAAELASGDASTIEHGCDSRAALLERYETTRESLYRGLRDFGYDRSISPVCCRIHVGRDGALLFGDGGHHRFYLSRLLAVESIPVQVLCRHREWQAIRETVARADTPQEIPPNIRTYLDHPDLRDLRPARTVGSDTTPTQP